jgi:hypothetical protein
MITEYINAALRRAKYEIVDDEEPYYGDLFATFRIRVTSTTLNNAGAAYLNRVYTCSVYAEVAAL